MLRRVTTAAHRKHHTSTHPFNPKVYKTLLQISIMGSVLCAVHRGHHWDNDSDMRVTPSRDVQGYPTQGYTINIPVYDQARVPDSPVQISFISNYDKLRRDRVWPNQRRHRVCARVAIDMKLGQRNCIS